MSKFKETKKVLSFLKGPDNMPKSGAQLEESNVMDPELLMEDILDAQPPSEKKRKKKKKKTEPESEFVPGQESTTVTGAY